jgi:cation diffusion facilitator CzcD-associated flavoprotein CzcO
MTAARRDHKVAILGAGPGGLCMGIKLKQAGIEDFVIIEKGTGLGGTWYHNRYPGCECDIPSHLYSFSFEIKPDWTKPYARQPEILEYLEGCANKYELGPHLAFNSTVRKLAWSDDDSRWDIELESGETVGANMVVSAIGMFNDLVYPNIEGLDTFGGTSFHSARWNWDHDIRGKTVGVIGSAASAVQFIPEIVKEAGQVHLFQRTANWVLPKEDEPYTEEQLEHFRANPEVAQHIRDEIFTGTDRGEAFKNPEERVKYEAAGRQAISVVTDPDTREKLTPTHIWGCKRPLFANNYYEAFNLPNIELITEGIQRVTERGVETVDGKERELDTLVLATGFDATKYLSVLDVTGRGGLDIQKAWEDGAQAYRGITTAGFPNLFMLYGPNINMGSLITMIEWQTVHILKHIERIEQEQLAWIDVRPEPMAAYNDTIQEDILSIEAWSSPTGCNTYYRAPSGRVVTQWPHTMGRYRDSIEQPEFEVYETAKR